MCSTTSHTSQAAQEPSFKVFINKFPLHVTRDNIKEHLKVCGLSKNVKRVCIFHDREKKKSKGCGYIEFTPVKIGRMAISKLNSTLLLGKHEIHAKKFSERKKQKSNNNNNKRPSPHPLQGAASSTALSLGGDEESHMNSEPGMSKVFVGAMGAKLPKSINNFHLRRHFKEFDSGIIRADIVKDPETRESKGYGFVTFKSKSVAQKAIKKLNHSLLHECTLKLQFATTSKAPQGRQQKPDTSSISMASTNRIQQTIQHEQAHFHTASPSDNPLAATSIPPLATGTSSPGPRSPLMPLPAATNIPSLATGMSSPGLQSPLVPLPAATNISPLTTAMSSPGLQSPFPPATSIPPLATGMNSPGLQSPLVPLPAATNISPLTTAMSSPGLQSPFPPATSIPPLATGMSSPGLQSPLVPFPAATNISPLTTATKNPSLLSPHLPVSNTVAVHNLNPAISKDEISVLCTGTIVHFDRNEVVSSATITFSSHHDAEMAIEKLNGKTLLGQTLSANLIQPAAVPVLNQPISPLSPVNIAHTNIVQTTGLQSTTESSATESIKLNPEQWNLLTAMNSAGSNLYQELSKPFVANPDVKIDLLIDKVTVVFTGKPAAVQSAWDYFRNGILRQIPIDL